jgi:hypothetical protein
MYLITIRGQPKMDGSPAWGLGVGIDNSSPLKKDMLRDVL